MVSVSSGFLVAASMLAIFTTNIVMFAIFCGIGLLVRRAFGLGHVSQSDCFIAFWMGLAATIWFLMLWNFLFPVNPAAFMAVAGVGAIGCCKARWELVRLFRSRPSPAVLLTLIVSGLWISNLAMGPMTGWDSGLYHFQAIKWARNYAAVPGLANLYGPLAFNNASFLYGALMLAGPWGQFAHHITNSTLVFAVLMQCVISGFSVAAGTNKPNHLFEFFVLTAVVALINPAAISSFSTDLPTTLTMLAAMSMMYAWLSSDDSEPEERAYLVVSITTLLTLAVCFKFGTAVFAATAWALTIATWLAGAKARFAKISKPVLWSVLITGGMGLSWMARGIVLSGYPLFPMAIASAPVVWRAPLEHAQAELAMIVHSGRLTAAVLGVLPGAERFSVWFPRWVPRLLFEVPFEVLVPLVLALAGILFYLARRRNNPVSKPILRGWLVLLPVGPAVLSWIASAPEPRYVMYVFWTLAAVCCAQAMRIVRMEGWNTVRRRQARWVAIMGVLIGISPAIVNPILSEPHLNPLTAIKTANLNRAPIGRATTLDVPKSKTFVTDSGLHLNVPIRTGGRCIDLPLPCTPNPARNLRLRDSRDPAKGFVVDGQWQMEDWPYDWFPHFLEAWRALQRDGNHPATPSSIEQRGKASFSK